MENESSNWVIEPDFVEETETQDERYNLHKHVSVCKKNDKHLQFYPYNWFLGKRSKLFRIIEILGNLTVKISVCRTKGKKGTLFGSGMLVSLVDVEELTSYTERCLFFTIITANHVFSDEEEAKNAKIEFFNNVDVSCDSNIARGLKILASNRDCDFIEVLCVTKDISLASRLKTLLNFKTLEEEQVQVNFFPKMFLKMRYGAIKPEQLCITLEELACAYAFYSRLQSNINEFIFEEYIIYAETYFSDYCLPNYVLLRDFLYFVNQLLKSTNKSDEWVNIINGVNMESSPTINSAVQFWTKETKDDLAIHIGHPHGMSKHVTIGEIISTNTDTGHYTFMYNTPTCPGCSGGPVFVVPRECLKGGAEVQIQWNKIFAAPHARAHNSSDEFICNMSSSWTMYFDDSISETQRISLTKEEIADIKTCLDSDDFAE